MPITKSAAKAMRGSARKRVVNLVTIDKYKNALKDARKAIAAKNKDTISKTVSNAFAQLDKAVKKHIIHRNKAARLKSRLAKSVAKIS